MENSHFDYSQYYQKPVPKKKKWYQKIKESWNNLSQNDRDWIKAVGVAALDGVMIGSMVTAAVKNKKMKNKVKNASLVGFCEGAMYAYKDVAQNPLMLNKPTEIKKF